MVTLGLTIPDWEWRDGDFDIEIASATGGSYGYCRKVNSNRMEVSQRSNAVAKEPSQGGMLGKRKKGKVGTGMIPIQAQ